MIPPSRLAADGRPVAAGRRVPAWLGPLARLELILTVVPGIALGGAFAVGLAAFPPLAVLALIAAFFYLLPAFLVVNICGYTTIEGPAPIPMPASSPMGLAVVVAVHAALVAGLFVAYRLGAVLTGWAIRRH